MSAKHKKLVKLPSLYERVQAILERNAWSGQGFRVQALADRTGGNDGSIRQILNSMRAAGFVNRLRDGNAWSYAWITTQRPTTGQG